MILPYHLNPKNSLYYIGGNVLLILKKKSLSIDELYLEINKINKTSYTNLIYALDWLYIIDSIIFNESEELICLQKD